MRGLALLRQPHRTPQRRQALLLTLSCTALLLLLDDLACLQRTTFHTHGPWRMTHMAAAAAAGAGTGAGRAAGPRRSTVLRHGVLHPFTMLPAAAAQHDSSGDFKTWHVEDDPMEDDDDDYKGAEQGGKAAAGARKRMVHGQGHGQGEAPRCAPAYQGMVQHSKASCKAHLYTPGLFKMLADDRARQMGQSYLVGSGVLEFGGCSRATWWVGVRLVSGWPRRTWAAWWSGWVRPCRCARWRDTVQGMPVKHGIGNREELSQHAHPTAVPVH